MKRTQVALAALALMASTAALAEVKISGVMDVGVGTTSKDSNGAGGVYTSNGAYIDHSSIELDASEDLGSGMKAYVSLGMGFDPVGRSDNPGSGNGLFNRQSLIGLSGDFGSIQLGKQLSPFILSQVLIQNYSGMFGVSRMWLNGYAGVGVVGDGTQNPAGGFFIPNAVQYKTNPIMGWTGTIMASTPNGTYNNGWNRTGADSVDINKYTAYSLMGPIGPINATAAYHKLKNTYSAWNVGGTMPLTSELTLSAGYVDSSTETGNLYGVAAVDVASWNVGAAYALTGATTVSLQHGQNDKNGGNQKLTNIMLSNALSKQTTIYATYHMGKNGIGSLDNFGSKTLANDPGSNTAFVVGVAHKF